jgi:anti-anti-sigma regulatory factor
MSGGEAVRVSDFTMRTISTLHEELLRELSGKGAVAIDLSGVQRPNTAVLQLLVAFARDLGAQARSIEWRGESAAFDRAVKALGLGASLGLPADG